ncbi:MAG TPA: hypothetical protein VKR55_06690 [Bradyrhizobium sp.]|uniref:hypothetical protein n=1 Tax=Bradyrhizobium sp. TaxID=376 RepID=UPI002D1A91D4|nr:hypothetical protein [Bradyrhizobium sp.]HLZ01824.1 hypothetical protein [Bradyrhizobium sp.]
MSDVLYDDGDGPSELWFKNHQWAVTDYGVEVVKPTSYYHFDKTRLLESTDYGSGELYDWPVHMAEKTWVDIEAFIEVFLKALELHAGSYRGNVDKEMLTKSLARARKEALRR